MCPTAPSRPRQVRVQGDAPVFLRPADRLDTAGGRRAPFLTPRVRRRTSENRAPYRRCDVADDLAGRRCRRVVVEGASDRVPARVRGPPGLTRHQPSQGRSMSDRGCADPDVSNVVAGRGGPVRIRLTPRRPPRSSRARHFPDDPAGLGPDKGSRSQSADIPTYPRAL